MYIDFIPICATAEPSAVDTPWNIWFNKYNIWAIMNKIAINAIYVPYIIPLKFDINWDFLDLSSIIFINILYNISPAFFVSPLYDKNFFKYFYYFSAIELPNSTIKYLQDSE